MNTRFNLPRNLPDLAAHDFILQKRTFVILSITSGFRRYAITYARSASVKHPLASPISERGNSESEKMVFGDTSTSITPVDANIVMATPLGTTSILVPTYTYSMGCTFPPSSIPAGSVLHAKLFYKMLLLNFYFGYDTLGTFANRQPLPKWEFKDLYILSHVVVPLPNYCSHIAMLI